MSLLSLVYVTSTPTLWRISFRPWRRVLTVMIELVRLTVENKNTHTFFWFSPFTREQNRSFFCRSFSLFPGWSRLDGGRGRGRWWRPTPPPHHRAQQKLTPSEGVGPSSLRHLSCQCGLFTWEGENGGRSKSLTQHSISYHDGDDCHHKCDPSKIWCHLFLPIVDFSLVFPFFAQAIFQLSH